MDDWVEINGYPGYRINDQGQIWSNKLKRVLNPPLDKYGYQRIGLWCDCIVKRFRVHRLVAEHFIPNPEDKPCVNHIDGDKTNNDISNLEWTTVAENNEHSRTILGNNGTKGIHSKPVTLTKDDTDYVFSQTRDAQKFLKASWKSWCRLQNGLKSNINGFKLKSQHQI